MNSVSPVTRIDINLVHMILGFHSDIIFSEVLHELKKKQLQYMDKYFVSTKDFPSRQQVVVTTIISPFIGKLETDPGNILERNRKSILYELSGSNPLIRRLQNLL